MLSETFQSIAVAARAVFRNWQSLSLIAIAYAFFLAVLYSFVVIREATFVQVSLTFASAIIAPLLFFVLQAMIAADADDPLAVSRQFLEIDLNQLAPHRLGRSNRVPVGKSSGPL